MNMKELKAQLEHKHHDFEARMQAKEHLQQILTENHIKFDADAIIAIDQKPDGQIFFLERGNERAGYKHVLNHAKDFNNKGVNVAKLPQFIMHTLKNNQQVSVQNARRGGRPIYHGTLFAQNNHEVDVAISVGSNGFIVGANPVTLKK